MKTKKGNDKARMKAIVIISLLVIATGVLFSLNAFMKGDAAGGIGGVFIAIIVLAFAISAYMRGNKALKEGYPLHDERSRQVILKAQAMAFMVSLYMLLAIGFFSDTLIKFEDVSQAMGIAVGGMALLFAGFWWYYSRKEI